MRREVAPQKVRRNATYQIHDSTRWVTFISAAQAAVTAAVSMPKEVALTGAHTYETWLIVRMEVNIDYT